MRIQIGYWAAILLLAVSCLPGHCETRLYIPEEGVEITRYGPEDGLSPTGYGRAMCDRRGHVMTCGYADGERVINVWDGERWSILDLELGSIEDYTISPDGEIWLKTSEGMFVSPANESWPPVFERREICEQLAECEDMPLFGPDGFTLWKNESLLFHLREGHLSTYVCDAAVTDATLRAWDYEGVIWMSREIYWGRGDVLLFSFDGRELTGYDWTKHYMYGGDLAIDTAGNVWEIFPSATLVTRCGIVMLARDGSHRNYNVSTGHNFSMMEYFTAIAVGTDDIVWITTWGAGGGLSAILICIEDGELRLRSTRNLLPAIPNGIAIDHRGRKWMTGEGGILCYDDSGAPEQKVILDAALETDDDAAELLKVRATLLNTGDVAEVDFYLAIEHEGQYHYYPHWGTHPHPLRAILPSGYNNQSTLIEAPRSELTLSKYRFLAAISLPNHPEHLIGRPGEEIQAKVVRID